MLPVYTIVLGALHIASASVVSASSSSSSASRRSLDHNHRINQLEINSLSGVPAYKSVNLTWSVTDAAAAAAADDDDSHDGVVSGGAPPATHQQPLAFTVHYCEMHVWGAHRCRATIVEDGETQSPDSTGSRNERSFATNIGKLRMATKYLFHVRLLNTTEQQLQTRKASGRSSEGVVAVDQNEWLPTQSIVIPTKEFVAHATKCLADASDIEVETGPHFGGRIVAEDGGPECGVEGDERSDRSRYVLRIDHQRCGSQVDQETLTVRTSITVQENLGIFTHSTRRFLVVCSYQPDTLMVRTSFSVPSKHGTAAVQPQQQQLADRSGRKRAFRAVGKEALVLREVQNYDDAVAENHVRALDAMIGRYRTARVRPADAGRPDAELSADSASRSSALVNDRQSTVDAMADSGESRLSFMGLGIVASLSAILLGVILYIARREHAKRRRYQSSI